MTFARAFSKAIDENNEKQIMLEKASAKAAAAENGISSPERDARPSISSKDSNIFSRFQASQAASSNDVVAEFKSKLARKFQKANSSTEY